MSIVMILRNKNILQATCVTQHRHDNITYQKYSSRLMTYDNGTAWNLNSSINVFL